MAVSFRKRLPFFQKGVDDQGIKHLDLEELNASNNLKITTLNHMKKLRKIDIGYDCGRFL